MEDRFRFRVWDGKKMIHPEFITENAFALWTEDSMPRLSKKIMQCTGLKDKNGELIYEGDIIRRIEKTVCCGKKKIIGEFVTVWEGNGFYTKNEDYDLLGFAGDDNREIIGNVHENPDPVEGGGNG